MKNLDKKKIISLTKIKEPFLMIDKVKNIISLKSATGIKHVKKNSWFLKCHFQIFKIPQKTPQIPSIPLKPPTFKISL